MSINLVYQRANKDAYDMLKVSDHMQTADELGNLITNTIFPSILNKIGDVIQRSDFVERNYDKFKIPLSEFGAITEYLTSNMIKADNASDTSTGSVVQDYVVNNPDIQAIYATKLIRANYPITIQSERWLDALDGKNYSTLASMIAIAVQSLYDGIMHDHDSLIPALFGSLYESSPKTSKRTIPEFDGNSEAYAKKIFAILNKGIRDLTTWRRPDFNMMKMEMVDPKSDLALVVFDNPVDVDGETPLDVISSQLSIGAMARAKALGEALGITVYEMPSMGIIETSVARAYNLNGFPGMQSADMKDAENLTLPYPNIKMALVGKGALNVGLKRLQQDTGRSVRGHFDQTWVQPTLQTSYGAGQVIFFGTSHEETE